MSDNNIPQIDAPRFRDRLDMGQIVFRLVDRVNLAASRTFESGILQKINNLPMSWREWVEDQDSRYVEEKPTFIYEAPTGFPIGTEDKPALIDENIPVRKLPGEIDWENDENIAGAVDTSDDDDDYEINEPVLFDDSVPVMRLPGEEIDWTDPNIWSPKMVMEDYVDYVKMDAVIMEAHEYAGLTYQTELMLVDGGDTLEQIEKRKRTPHRKPREPEPEAVDQDE